MAEGHIRKRGNTWQIAIYLGKDSDGKKKYKYQTVNGTKREAQKVMTELLHQLNTNTFVDPGRLTFGQYLERFINEYCITKLSPKSLKDYSGMIRRDISPALGHIQLSKLQPLDLQNYYTKLLQRMSPTSVLYQHRVIHRALEMAVKWQLVYRNVADAVEAPRKAEYEFSVADSETIKMILTFMKEHHPVAYLPIVVAAYTGMRRSEVCGLRWKDVAIKAKQISVRKQLQRVNGELILRDTKTRQGRSIPLPDFLADMLKKHKAQQNELRIAGLKNEFDLVFIWPDDGRPIDPDYLSRVFIQRTCRKLGIENLRLHDLRHSFATLLLGRKVHPKVVQEILGHSSISLTLDTYSHVLPSMKEEVADILSNEYKINLFLDQHEEEIKKQEDKKLQIKNRIRLALNKDNAI